MSIVSLVPCNVVTTKSMKCWHPNMYYCDRTCVRQREAPRHFCVLARLQLWRATSSSPGRRVARTPTGQPSLSHCSTQVRVDALSRFTEHLAGTVNLRPSTGRLAGSSLLSCMRRVLLLRTAHQPVVVLCLLQIKPGRDGEASRSSSSYLGVVSGC